jgi:acetyl esterase/lipase
MALKLDLFQPKDRKTPSPVVIVLHGTGMFTKGRAAVHPHAEALAGSGYVALAVGFRHESKYAYPAALDDVDAAVKWVHANAAKYNLDTNNIGVVGYSGGGSLATMLSAKKPPRVRAVVSYFAPSDLAVLHQNSPWPEYLLIKPSLEQWIGGTPAKVPMKYKQASPITHVHKEMAPHLLIAGTKDRIVPDEQSKLLAQEMKKLGAQVNLLTFENAPHNFDEEKGMNAKLAFQATEFFLAEHLMRGRIVVAQQQSGAGAESAKTK